MHNKKKDQKGFSHIDDVMTEALSVQEELFRKKFGRDPEPNDPIFFDPDFDTPTPYSDDRLLAILMDDFRASSMNNSSCDAKPGSIKNITLRI